MLRVEKLKKFKNNFPILVGNKAISNHLCASLIKEISSSETFDDLIMGGRSRINKGSKNFKKYINKSKISKKLFQLFNSKKFYNKIENVFILMELREKLSKLRYMEDLVSRVLFLKL